MSICNECYSSPCNCYTPPVCTPLCEPICDPCTPFDDGCVKGLTNLKCTRYSGDDISCGELSITQADSGDEALGKIVGLICSIADNNNDKYVKISENDTTSGYLSQKLLGSEYIDLTTINPNINEKIRIDLNYESLLEDVLDDIPSTEDKYVRISPEDTQSLYLENKILEGDGIDITKYDSGGSEYLLIEAKVSPTSGNILVRNSTGLYVPTPTTFIESSLVANDSATIDFTQTGSTGHTLTGSVRISGEGGNFLTTNGGLFAGAADSSTIDFSTTGSGSTLKLTGAVRISAVAGNQLIDSSGLYIAPLTANSGLSKVGNNFILGGNPLLADTSIGGAYALSLTSGKLFIGTSNITDNKLFVFDNGTSEFTSIVAKRTTTDYGVGFLSTVTISNALNLSATARLTGVAGSAKFSQPGNVVLYTGGFGEASAIVGNVQISSTGNITNGYVCGLKTGLIASDSKNLEKFVGLNINNVMQDPDTSSTTYTGIVTTYIGLLINNLNTGLGATQVTNRYAIDQLGSTDIIRFAAKRTIKSTIKASGTAGAQTINKAAGRFNIAAGQTSVIITNSFVTTSSYVRCDLGTIDSTAKSLVVVESNGSFTCTLNAAATAEVKIKFEVMELDVS